jgi:hypothetical protein
MPANRAFGGVAYSSGAVYVVGGLNPLGTYENEVEAYAVATDSWVTCNAMPTPRKLLALQVGDTGLAGRAERLYAAGGSDGAGSWNNIFEMYNVVVDSWTTRRPMPYAAAMFSLGRLNEGVVSIRLQVHRYTASTDAWLQVNDAPTSRGSAAVAGSDSLYLVGGSHRDASTVERYMGVSDRWTTVASAPTERFYLGAVWHDSKLYATGGMNQSSASVAVSEVYDSLADLWTSTAALPAARYGHGSAETGNVIYVLGSAVTTDANTVERLALPPAAPSPAPSLAPSEQPSAPPSPLPSAVPTTSPTTLVPTPAPTFAPSSAPTVAPTTATPSLAPSPAPTLAPTGNPSPAPSSPAPRSVPAQLR